MPKHLFLAILVASVGLSACKNMQSTANAPTDNEAIIRACRNQVDAWRMQSYEDEADAWAHVPYALKMLTNGTRTIGWKNIGESYRESFGSEGLTRSEPVFTTALSDFYVRVNGTSAWVVFNQHQIFANEDGGQDIYKTLEVRCLEKINNEWRIVFQLTGPYSEG